MCSNKHVSLKSAFVFLSMGLIVLWLAFTIMPTEDMDFKHMYPVDFMHYNKTYPHPSRIAFAVVCTAEYWHYTYVLSHRIRRITSIQHDLLVLTPDATLPPHASTLFGPVGLKSRIIPVTLALPESANPLEKAFEISWIKLHLLSLTEYDQILYLDSDVVLLKDISPIFSHVKSFASVSLGCHLRPDLGDINGGFLLILPNITQYQDLLALSTTHTQSGWTYSEQELLAEYFLWMHPEQFTSLGEQFMLPYHALDRDQLLYTNYYGRHWLFTHRTELDLLNTVYSVHFLCGKKPWQHSLHCHNLDGSVSAKCSVIRSWFREAEQALKGVSYPFTYET
jgi:hypothetical protein